MFHDKPNDVSLHRWILRTENDGITWEPVVSSHNFIFVRLMGKGNKNMVKSTTAKKFSLRDEERGKFFSSSGNDYDHGQVLSYSFPTDPLNLP